MFVGSRMAPLTVASLAATTCHNVRAAGVNVEVVKKRRPAEDVAFEDHLTSALMWPPERVWESPGKYSAEARQYHPSLSFAHAVDTAGLPGFEVEGAEAGPMSYPTMYVYHYLKGIKQMIELSCESVSAVTPEDDAAASHLRQMGAGILPDDHVGALSAARDAVRAALHDASLGEAEAMDQMDDDRAWLEVRTLAKQSMDAAQWEIADAYLKGMCSAAERRAWLRVNATPGAGMDLLLRDLASTLQSSIARAATRRQ
jgi:hypothetical protein